MRKETLTIISALTAILFSGCEKNISPSPDFLSERAPVLTVQNRVRIRYVPETFQIGFNEDRHQFRIHNDTMSEYYILRCSGLPEEKGQKMKCSLKYASGGKTSYKGYLTYEVLKTDGNGTAWLWNSEKGIGAVVKCINPQAR